MSEPQWDLGLKTSQQNHKRNFFGESGKGCDIGYMLDDAEKLLIFLGMNKIL